MAQPQSPPSVAALLAEPTLRGRYPTRLLEDCRTAAVLFGAGFLGANDGAWIAAAGIEGVCVDRDAERLAEMRAAYPANWRFVAADVLAWARDAGRWDLVSVDPPTDLSLACLLKLNLWLPLAGKALVLGLQYETLKAAGLPSEVGTLDRHLARGGFHVTELMARNARSRWLVMEHLPPVLPGR